MYLFIYVALRGSQGYTSPTYYYFTDLAKSGLASQRSTSVKCAFALEANDATTIVRFSP